jgi:hypothetical protein
MRSEGRNQIVCQDIPVHLAVAIQDAGTISLKTLHDFI